MGVDFNLLSEVEKINAQQKRRFLSKVRSALWTLRGKRLAVLGLAFKGRPTTCASRRRSTWWRCCWARDAAIVAYDPAAMERARVELPPSSR